MAAPIASFFLRGAGCEVLSPLEGSFAHTPDFGKLWSPPPKPADGLAMESD